jgi:hypothetical protein
MERIDWPLQVPPGSAVLSKVRGTKRDLPKGPDRRLDAVDSNCEVRFSVAVRRLLAGGRLRVMIRTRLTLLLVLPKPMWQQVREAHPTKEQYPGVKPRVISDNGPQIIAKDFKEFIRSRV